MQAMTSEHRKKLSEAAKRAWSVPETRERHAANTALQRQRTKEAVTKHGEYRSPEYRTWVSVRGRCAKGGVYFGRIKVCDRWASPDSFLKFLADMGRRPAPGYEIERRDNDGDYEPDNCYWATRRQQMRNTGVNVRITLNGETKCAAAWADASGIPAHIIRRRIHDGWPGERAVYEPRNDNVIPKRARNRFTGKASA